VARAERSARASRYLAAPMFRAALVLVAALALLAGGAAPALAAEFTFDPPSQRIDEGRSVEVTVTVPGPFGVGTQSPQVTASGATSEADATVVVDDESSMTETIVRITAKTDAVYEEGEDITLRAEDGDEAVVTIRNTNPLPALALADAAAPEGARVAQLALTASGASEVPLTVPFTVAAGSAGAQDFGAPPASLVLQTGQTRAAVPVPLVDDAEDEADEQFQVRIGDYPSVSRGIATVTIGNDDLRAVSVADVALAEGGRGGANVARFVVSLSAPTARTVTVGYRTVDGSATAPADYLSRAGTLTFAPGVTSLPVDVGVVGDDAVEPGESFALGLTDLAGAVPDRMTATGVVVDDDVPPPAQTSTIRAAPGTVVPVGIPRETPAGREEDVMGPRMRMSRPRLRRGRLEVRLSCPSGEERCAGRLTLYDGERRLAAGRFRLRGGRAYTLRVAPPRRRAGARMRLQAYAVTEDVAGNVDTRESSATLRVRRAARR